jgi:hypothetical protein
MARLAPSFSRGLPLLLAALALAAPAAAADKKPPAQWDDLVRKESKTLQNVYVRPNAVFAGYQRVRLDPVNVEFDKNWDPNRGSVPGSKRLTSADITRIKKELAAAFREVFAATLTKGGYPLVEVDEDDVLRVGASLVNVYINAPEKHATGPVRSYAMDAGRMTLFMELRDAVTGQVLARAVDTQQGGQTNKMELTSETSNSTEAQAAFRAWSTLLVKALDEVNGKGAGK